ncbi:hypothetical protein L2719_07135 [Shewanella schlegeliana]|uniref:DUF4303 domain-containing protein n=1 Tax=Shewanella schlegeliana TaxID=190308 RepID=A0ABS1SXS8_9GAMM|nr:hypothetical protein [Shewanella schlegeliana]MBL4913362.1 hypothetical protein [Shewanella schlegeliana]MCL1109317.1 hypothetical protein [Shewanella schlegeliana]GIU38052.1 hypothetical protein TUM4433_39150 [Shewanella schlegeliana]
MIERIQNAYDGEIYGISFFSYLDNNYQFKASSKTLWKTLIQVETLTANLLENTLAEHQFEYDCNNGAMINKGNSDAQKWCHLPWAELVDTLVNWVEPYEKKYRDWADEARIETDSFRLIAEHETAIYECFKAEKVGISGEMILLDFINKYQAKVQNG